MARVISTQKLSSRPLKSATFLNKEGDNFQFNITSSNKLGVLNRVLLVFSRRGYSFSSLKYNEESDQRFSKISIDFHGHTHQMMRVKSEIDKLIDVVSVRAIQKPREKPRRSQIKSGGERNVL